jgi:N-acetylglutamate synthase-like GNAT family acetyltransferase
MYFNVDNFFTYFWCLFDDEMLIGTVALKRLGAEQCELKSLYLLEQ